MSPKFRPGQVVRLASDPGQRFPVLAALAEAGSETRYQVWHENRQVVFYESQLAEPEEERGRRAVDAETLRSAITALQLLSPSAGRLYSLNSGRIDHIPHQYRPVLKLVRADRPRLLIADEVGVGKTIEAGLVLKELEARTDLRSVLIICPKALVSERKWLAEMRRFDEEFVHLDGATLRYCLEEADRDGCWPGRFSRAIIPFSLFSEELLHGRPRRGRAPAEKGLADLEDAGLAFDLVIVDEAHHLRNPATWLHRGVKYFCDRAEAALFLTATPVQLEERDLFTLLNLLRPDLVIDEASFSSMSEPNAHLNAAVSHCRERGPGWRAAALASLRAAGATAWGRLFVAPDPSFREAARLLGEGGEPGDDLRVALVERLESLYTFAPLINRTRRRDVGAFTTRKPATEEVPFTPEQQALHDALLEALGEIHARKHGRAAVSFLLTTVRRQAASCLHGLAPLLRDLISGKLAELEAVEVGEEGAEAPAGDLGDLRSDLERVAALAERLPAEDPKAERLERVLAEALARPGGKALAFSTFRHTLGYLEARLSAAGLRVGLVTGDVEEPARRELRRRFALGAGSADALDVLLSSEVGSEGLDFQFCDFLVNYDLPWNPMRVEQRIGRVDRYGQRSEAVSIVNFVTPGTVDADIYHRCLWRIGVFEASVGGSEAILGEVTRGLRSIAENFALTAEERHRRLEQLADNQIRRARAQQELEEREAELFGLRVGRDSWERALADASSAYLSAGAIESLVSRYLGDDAGLAGPGPVKTLRAGREARARLLADLRRLPQRPAEAAWGAWEAWLKGGSPHLAVAFEQAGAREDAGAVLVDAAHPLVRQAAASLAPSEPLVCALRVASDEVPPGDHPFAVYCWEKTGVRPDQQQVAVAFEPEVRERLFGLLAAAEDASLPGPDESALRELERTHYALWGAERAEHYERNRRLVEFRLESLKASHGARVAALEAAHRGASDRRIAVMKAAEAARVGAEYARRVDALEAASRSADVIVSATVFGVLRVRPRTRIEEA